MIKNMLYMKLLIENDVAKFEEYVSIYQKFFSTYVNLFGQAIDHHKYNDSLPLSVERDVWEYHQYLQYPIRKLEYSFMLYNTPDLNNEIKTLDAGCGVTPTARYFASEGCESFGVDVKSETIDYLKNPNNILYDSSVNYSVQNLTNLKFENDFFDIITCISVFEHLNPGDDTLALKELLRVLKPNGKIILTVDFGTKANLYNLKFGFDLIKQRKFKQIIQRLQKNGIPFKQNDAYNFDKLKKRIIKPFEENIQDEIPKSIDVSEKEIGNFWKTYWQPGFFYRKDRPRTYVSVGMILTK